MGYLSNIGGYTSIVSTKISKTDGEWRAELTPEEYDILRAKGTERPFSGEYGHTKAAGTYCCAACGAQLLSSTRKSEPRTGWRGWDRAATLEAVGLRSGHRLFMP